MTLSIRFTRQDGLVALAVVEHGGTLVLGRDLGCDVRLDGRKVSRRHLRLDNRVDGVFVVADAGSHNGTFVNGARVSEVGTAVSLGDLVTAGEWEGRIELKASEVRRAAPYGPPNGPNVMPMVSEATFDGVTDPNAPRLNPMHASAVNMGARPPMATQQLGSLRGPGTPTQTQQTSPPAAAPPTAARATTMVLPMSMRIAENMERSLTPGKEWNWEESSQPPAGDNLRAARVDENPIVKRFAETSTQLDFRGLSDLPVDNQPTSNSSVTGLRAPTAGIDGIALRLVFKVTEALQSTDSMDDFLREMCEQLSAAARAKGVVVLLPDENMQMVPRVVKQRRVDEKMQLSRTVIDYVVRNKAALTTEDAAADERFARGESVLRFDLKAVLCVPLVRRSVDTAATGGTGGGDVVGVLYLTRDLPFTNTERDLVAALAHLIAMGLERTRLREEFANAERTRRSLERFHAPDVVRRLMMESSQGVHRDGLFLEPLTATVLFCDLAGFTTFCEGHEPEQVGMLLNSYLATMTETVFAHGGTVDKFIGDAVMCIFGAPFMTHDDALRGVRCAIEMRRNFRALVGAGAVGDDARQLDVHIGVNTGKVVAGTVGSPRRMEYTALGDTVNTAARLEGVAKKGQIVLGPVTASLVQDHVPLRSMGAHTLKGKGAPVELYEVPDE
ncbi:MAG: adenylate/guanylate cyclase domain-containing protein [Deltaproteobacteria bacterium]|nr:adenylate/guanylate cyclase domain-containing protein [Deltaproteobacteria bacterium]